MFWETACWKDVTVTLRAACMAFSAERVQFGIGACTLQVSKHGSVRAAYPPTRFCMGDPQSGPPPFPKPAYGRDIPVEMPRMQVGMRSSRSSSSLEVQPSLAEHAPAEQHYVAVAGQPNLAINPGSWHLPAKPSRQPNLAPASGTQQSPSTRHYVEEVCLPSITLCPMAMDWHK